eukprot:scaffold318892_cov13-Tisochrysis_lutea.AAC.2
MGWIAAWAFCAAVWMPKRRHLRLNSLVGGRTFCHWVTMTRFCHSVLHWMAMTFAHDTTFVTG